MGKSYKLRVYEILEATDPEDKIAERVNIFLLALVVLNVAAVVLETVESLYRVHKDIFYYISSVSLIVFTVEYFLRVWSCDVDPKL